MDNFNSRKKGMISKNSKIQIQLNIEHIYIYIYIHETKRTRDEFYLNLLRKMIKFLEISARK